MVVLSAIYDFIGNVFGEERPPEDFGDSVEFKPGALTDLSICYIQVSTAGFIHIPSSW